MKFLKYILLSILPFAVFVMIFRMLNNKPPFISFYDLSLYFYQFPDFNIFVNELKELTITLKDLFSYNFNDLVITGNLIKDLQSLILFIFIPVFNIFISFYNVLKTLLTEVILVLEWFFGFFEYILI